MKQLLTCLMLTASLSLYGQIPRTISFQGILTDADGEVLPDDSYQLTLHLYDAASGGNPLWEETQSVETEGGLFQIILGSVNSIELDFDRSYWLGIRVDGGAEMEPRTALTSVPYALNDPSLIPGRSLAVLNAGGDTSHILRADGTSYQRGAGAFQNGLFIPLEGDTLLHIHARDGWAYIGPDTTTERNNHAIGVSVTRVSADELESNDLRLNNLLEMAASNILVRGNNNQIGYRPANSFNFEFDGLLENKVFIVKNGDGENVLLVEPSLTGNSNIYNDLYVEGTFQLADNAVFQQDFNLKGNFEIFDQNDDPFCQIINQDLDRSFELKIDWNLYDESDELQHSFQTDGSSTHKGITNLYDKTNVYDWSSFNFFNPNDEVIGNFNFDDPQDNKVGAYFSDFYDIGIKTESPLDIRGTYLRGYDDNGDITYEFDPNADPVIGYAGLFNGNVMVNGFFEAQSKSFVIDHPTEPEQKVLRHYSMESDAMRNMYDGTVTLDAKGEAIVRLPDWFEALNKDFRYQLTCIGGFDNVYIAEKIEDNQFKIAGGYEGLEVSWQVTGIRHDPWAEKHFRPVVEEKSKRTTQEALHHTQTLK